MTETGFAVKMERKAREFIDQLIEDGVLAEELYGDNRNFKPWYSPRDLIDQTAKNGRVERVLIGVNPGGCPGERDPTTKERCWERPMNDVSPFNAYIAERWKGAKRGEASLQSAVLEVFKALYGTKCESKLRNTICFNVCPVRTHDASCIPPQLWTKSVQWCLEVLECLNPKRIICFAVFDKNGKPAHRSPWRAINCEYQIERNFCSDVKRWRNDFAAFVLAGYARTGALSDCEVIGVPHLSYHHRNKKMYDALRNLAPQ